MERHTDDLWNVREGDTVEIQTSEGHVFEAECVRRNTSNADPHTGEVRETTLWIFDAVEWKPSVSIIQGLRSSPSDPEFPVHNAAWCLNQDQNLGYIEELTIYGQME